jgi:hypothetical protein
MKKGCKYTFQTGGDDGSTDFFNQIADQAALQSQDYGEPDDQEQVQADPNQDSGDTSDYDELSQKYDDLQQQFNDLSQRMTPNIGGDKFDDGFLNFLFSDEQQGPLNFDELENFDSDNTAGSSYGSNYSSGNKGVNPRVIKTEHDILGNYNVSNLGIWGDEAHQRRQSDHNTGDAQDFGFKDLATGEAVAKKLQTEAGERGVKYIIFNGKIWNPSVSNEWRPYDGPDKHDTHVHVSYVRQTGGYGKYVFSPDEQHRGLNDPAYDRMTFPMQGHNTFRGLDNGQPVSLLDQMGNHRILVGPHDQAQMYGTVHEQRMAAGGENDTPAPVYKTQAEVDAANALARSISARHHHDAINPGDVYVARKVGDPMVPYLNADGTPYRPKPSKPLSNIIPDGLTLDDIQSAEGYYWYNDPHTGDVVNVDPSVINQPRFRKPAMQTGGTPYIKPANRTYNLNNVKQSDIDTIRSLFKKNGNLNASEAETWDKLAEKYKFPHEDRPGQYGFDTVWTLDEDFINNLGKPKVPPTPQHRAKYDKSVTGDELPQAQIPMPQATGYSNIAGRPQVPTNYSVTFPDPMQGYLGQKTTYFPNWDSWNQISQNVPFIDARTNAAKTYGYTTANRYQTGGGDLRSNFNLPVINQQYVDVQQSGQAATHAPGSIPLSNGMVTYPGDTLANNQIYDATWQFLKSHGQNQLRKPNGDFIINAGNGQQYHLSVADLIKMKAMGKSLSGLHLDFSNNYLPAPSKHK